MNYRRLFTQNGFVFLTIVTNNRVPILIDNFKFLKQAYYNVCKYYKFTLIAYVVQPDHIHCIVKPDNINEYPKIVKSFKYSFTKLINVGLVNPTYGKIWQNRYWEHTIKNEDDLIKHLDYIHYNPVKHSYADKVKDWKYSSFSEFVKSNLYDENWGNENDIKSIVNMNLE